MTDRAIFRIPPPPNPAIAAAAEEADRRQAAEREARRRAQLIRDTIPGGRREWARLDAPELEARVASQTAIAATRRAVQEPYVVWMGGSGRGKTTLACAALRARIEGGYTSRPLYAPAWKLAVARSRHPLGAGEPELVERALKADLLVLDELTDQHNPTSAVPDVIFEREAEGLATWITTWQSPKQIADVFGAGIARRIFQRGVQIDCDAGVRAK